MNNDHYNYINDWNLTPRLSEPYHPAKVTHIGEYFINRSINITVYGGVGIIINEGFTTTLLPQLEKFLDEL